MTLKDQLEKLAKEYPLVLHTDAGRTFSTVRRMKAEKRIGVPIFLRTGFAISTETGKAANTMTGMSGRSFTMLYLNGSTVIIQTYTTVYFHPMKTAKERMQIEPGFPEWLLG